MKKMVSALAIFAAMGLTACAHGGHHNDCCSGECKMDKSKKSCCGDECQMKDKKDAASTGTESTTK